MQAPHKRLLFATATLAVCGLSFAQQGSKSRSPISNVPYRGASEHWNWTKEEWTADSRPFTLIRRSIDNAVAKGAKPASLALKYRATAKQKPHDPQAQFRWAYAAYRKALVTRDTTVPQMVDYDELYAADLALDVFPAPSPRAYEYTRLRFLIGVLRRPARELKALGYRLLRHNAQDNEVMYRFGDVLNQDLRDVRDRREALRMAEELVRRDPRNAKYQAGLAIFHAIMWQDTKAKEEGTKAIAGYKKYLQLAPPNALFRKRAQWWISYIQKKQ